MKLFETYANVYRVAMFQRLPRAEQQRQPRSGPDYQRRT